MGGQAPCPRTMSLPRIPSGSSRPGPTLGRGLQQEGPGRAGTSPPPGQAAHQPSEGLPGARGETRRRSGATARTRPRNPMLSRLEGLSNEILQGIASHLHVEDPRLSGKFATAFASASQHLESVLSNDAAARFLHPLTKQLRNSFESIDANEKVFASPQAELPLAFLSKQQRTDFVSCAQMFAGLPLHDAHGRPLPMARQYARGADGQFGLVCALGRGIEHLQPNERTAVYGLAMTLTDSTKRAQALSALAQGGLEHLTEDERRFVVMNISLMPDADKVVALEGLGQGLGRLGAMRGDDKLLRTAVLEIAASLSDPAHREAAVRHLSVGQHHLGDLPDEHRLLPAAIAFELAQEPGSTAASAACAGFRELGRDERSQLFGLATQQPHPRQAAQALAGFMSSMQFLKKEERESMFDQLAASHDPGLLFEAQGAASAPGKAPPSWVGLKHLDDGRRQQLTDLATGPHKSVASLRAMASGLAWLSEPQRKAVADAISTLDDAGRAQVYAGLGPFMQHLDRGQREQVAVDVAHRLQGEAQAAALRGIGPGLSVLAHGDQQALLATLDRIEDPVHKAQAMAGLCSGWAGVGADTMTRARDRVGQGMHVGDVIRELDIVDEAAIGDLNRLAAPDRRAAQD